MAKIPVPEDYDALVRDFDPMVHCVMHRRGVPYDLREDLRQHIYEMAMHRNILSRWRVYCEQHQTSFTSSFYPFCSNLISNFLRDLRVRHRYEVAAFEESPVRVVRGTNEHGTELWDLTTGHTEAPGVDAGIMLDAIEATLPPDLRETLDACRAEGEVSARAVTRHYPRRNGGRDIARLREAARGSGSTVRNPR